MSHKLRLAVQLIGVFLVVSLLLFGVYQFNMILVLGAFFASFFVGRLFCGWFCPMGTWMEYVVSRISRNKEVPNWIKSKIFRGAFFVAFALFFYWAFMSLPRPWNGFAVMGVMVVFGTGLGVLFAPKTWCGYACPWGSIMSLSARQSGMFSHSVQDCKKCYVCSKACYKPDMLREELESHPGDGPLAKMPDCIGCQKCVTACPKNKLCIE